ncbi:MAG: isoprenylcysteine carboxylmethyltransferase family protein [Planctomycetota bacterium]
MNLNEIPQTVVALSISAYWTCVVFMSIRSRIRFRTPSGSLPKTKIERLMWLLWVPTIIAWIALTWNSSNVFLESTQGTWLEGLSLGLVAITALSVLTAFLLTIRCWLAMGKNWTMAVRPDKETELITDGVFANVRHPIYALSLILMVGSLIVVCNVQMLLVAIIHCSMLYLKSSNEEKYLTQTHGEQYVSYLQHTNRFFPIRAIRNRFANAA